MGGLRVSQEGEIVRAMLDLGAENLLDGSTTLQLTELLIDPPPGARLLRLGAVGEVFCLGRERAAQTPEGLREEVGNLVALNRALAASPLVTVAEVQGDAAGFGVGLVALADVAVAAATVRFWFPEVEIDLAPVVVLTWLPRMVGRRSAFELTATGRRMTAQEALHLGLVNAVAGDRKQVSSMVDDWMDRLLGFSGRVHGEIKDYLRATQDLDESSAYELAVARLVLGSLRRAISPSLLAGTGQGEGSR
jgi:methylglutaconyl-CoA hydratase